MEITLVKAVQQALCTGLNECSHARLTAEQIHLCPRAAAASCYVGEDAKAFAKQYQDGQGLAFPMVRNVPLVAEVWECNDWLLFAFTDAFYDAAVEELAKLLPYPTDDAGNYAENRMLALARKPQMGVARESSVQRALWLAVCMTARPSLRDAAERALLTMGAALAPKARMELLRRCGSVGDAAARLLHMMDQK